jgi:hypothetical protein
VLVDVNKDYRNRCSSPDSVLSSSSGSNMYSSFKYNPKISDFGLACFSDEAWKCETFRGTARYSAPEANPNSHTHSALPYFSNNFFKCDNFRNKWRTYFTNKYDIFSLGYILFKVFFFFFFFRQSCYANILFLAGHFSTSVWS